TDDCTNGCKKAVCGDNLVDKDGMHKEQCDPGSLDTNTKDCNKDCTLNVCGDGKTNPNTEECDNGMPGVNTIDCTSTCKKSACGDHFVNLSSDKTPANDPDCKDPINPHPECREVCDPPDVHDSDPTHRCSANCLSDETCGNGIIDTQVGEGCDPPNPDPKNFCSDTCQGAACGNNNLDPGEQCDGGAADTVFCNGLTAPEKLRCQIAQCGDGYTNSTAHEQCDPGQVGKNSPACNSNCTIAACGDGIVNPLFITASGHGEDCDPGLGADK